MSPQFVLYSYFRSSASHRARIALHIKGIEFEYRAIHLINNGGEQLQPNYAELNPNRQVPTLVHEVGGKQHVIGQSLAIMDYLDQIQPQTPLFPHNAVMRAICWQACEIINSGTQPLFNLAVLNELGKRFAADQEKKNEWTRHWMRNGLEALETLLRPHAGIYCLGDQLSAADCVLIPQLYSSDRFELDLSPYPTLTKIRENCERLAPFKKSSPFVQIDCPAELRA